MVGGGRPLLKMCVVLVVGWSSKLAMDRPTNKVFSCRRFRPVENQTKRPKTKRNAMKVPSPCTGRATANLLLRVQVLPGTVFSLRPGENDDRQTVGVWERGRKKETGDVMALVFFFKKKTFASYDYSLTVLQTNIIRIPSR